MIGYCPRRAPASLTDIQAAAGGGYCSVIEIDDWDAAIEDPGRTLFERHEQRDLLQRWLISYWTRLGTIAFVPRFDDIVRPGRVDVMAEANRTESE